MGRRFRILAVLPILSGAMSLACGSSTKQAGVDAGGAGGGSGDRGGGGFGGGGASGNAGRGQSGAGGSAGDAPVSALYFGFDADEEGFALDGALQTQPPYDGGNLQNLGSVPNGEDPPRTVFDGTFGTPAPGSLVVSATFNDYYQTVLVRRAYPVDQPVDLRGLTVTAQVKRVNDGRDFTGTVRLFARAAGDGGSSTFGQGVSKPLVDYKWHTLELRLADPDFAEPLFDPSHVIQIGIQLASGAPSTEASAGGGDAGDDGGTDAAVSEYGPPQPVSFYLDTIASN